MSDKRENGKSPTAKDLLSRLKKKSGENDTAEKKNTSYSDFVARREQEAKAEELADLPLDDLDFNTIYDEVYAEAREEEIKNSAPTSYDIAASEFFGEASAVEEDAVTEEAVSEELIFDDEPALDEYAPAEADEYAQYFAEMADESLEAYDEYGVGEAEDVYVPDAEYNGATYDEAYVTPEADTYYEDVIPDDDFFDNDPIEDEYEEEYAEEEYVEEEYDEERDFENLVNEVTGGASIDEIDETDISLMVALGMEEELAKTVGEETASQITDDYVAEQEEWVDRADRFGADEYTDPEQNGDIADVYRKRNMLSFWKMIASFVLAAVLLVFENLPVVGFQLAGPFDPAVYPVVYIMADLQIFLFIAALVFIHIARGIRDAVSFRPSVDCLPAILTVAAVVNSVVLAATTVPGVEPVLFNFVAALCLVCTAINDYMTVRREIFSFNIVSSRKPKFVMRRLSTRDSVLESEAVADMDAQGADEGDIIKIQKTDFVDGYFWRTKSKSTVSRAVIGLCAVLSVALAVVVAVYAFVTKTDNAINTGFAVLSAAVPACMVVSGFYPFYRANRRAYDNDSTIIGETSVEEYSGVGVISFDDVNVFPSYSVKVRNVRLFNNSRIDKVLYYAASVFSATGGPLADVFEVATMETGHSDNVQILETGTGYIEAEVNGRSIMFGRAQALAKHGILIPDEVVEENSDIPVDCSVMYMIYQRKLVAKMIVNYVLDPDFEYVLKQLTVSGMCVCVKTFDPNIDEEMICRQIAGGKYSMRVIKYKNTEEITKYSRRAEGGIVSRDNTKSLLHTVSYCDKILSAKKTGFVISVLAAILNAVIMAVVLMSGSFGSLYSVYIALCQIFWLIPVVITTKLIVR